MKFHVAPFFYFKLYFALSKPVKFARILTSEVTKMNRFLADCFLGVVFLYLSVSGFFLLTFLYLNFPEGSILKKMGVALVYPAFLVGGKAASWLRRQRSR